VSLINFVVSFGRLFLTGERLLLLDLITINWHNGKRNFSRLIQIQKWKIYLPFHCPSEEDYPTFRSVWDSVLLEKEQKTSEKKTHQIALRRFPFWKRAKK